MIMPIKKITTFSEMLFAAKVHNLQMRNNCAISNRVIRDEEAKHP
tara:strand:- start:6272 stop:6406 length:135 start_codon:yes stop_codon:yes gene_type:complete